MKEIMKRGILGSVIGIAIGFIITIIVSLMIGGGSYLPCEPSLTPILGSEIGAVVLQAIMSGVIGFTFGAASTIWEKDKWSIAKQTGVYLLIVSVVMFPIAFFLRWMEHSIRGVAIYGGIFLGIFLVIWLSNYFRIKRKVNILNERMKDKK